ncbi:hypothetical protein SAMN05216323_104223 [Williamwhitmania taraxaci]|uniref:Uncharacterized protein n=1 Tax=Williamwhitmania taraxaci TaxID=1640674 RepID=A0A1G6NE00_9BACT|nr:hypothetical protein SAMN05216323_104223 [Williamwhitmania taraxaci]
MVRHNNLSTKTSAMELHRIKNKIVENIATKFLLDCQTAKT